MPSYDQFKQRAPKRKASFPSSSRKKIRTLHSVNDLPWRYVSRIPEAGVAIDEGILDLEEIEGVEVIYDETEGGRIARFNVRGRCACIHSRRIDGVPRRF
jgi:ATP-dependent RNA helicase DDX24/MAK5